MPGLHRLPEQLSAAYSSRADIEHANVVLVYPRHYPHAYVSWLTQSDRPQFETLSRNYNILTTLCSRNKIRYIPAYAGLFMLAKLAPHAQTWEDEAAMVQKAKDAGVSISPGYSYHIVESERGWARVTFAVEPSVFDEALRRLEGAPGFVQQRRMLSRRRRRRHKSGEASRLRRTPDLSG